MTTTRDRSASESKALNALRVARRQRDSHAEVCASWDYESDGGCDECQRTAMAVRAKLAAYDRAFGR